VTTAGRVLDEAEDSSVARAERAALASYVARWEPDIGRDVMRVLGELPRHLFIPHVTPGVAYEDEPQAIGAGQTISQPLVVAMMTHALGLQGDEHVLEIGTGSGYQTAFLAELAHEVWSIERVRSLHEGATRLLARLGYRNVRLRHGDGFEGWPEGAPFDRLIFTAAPPELPEGLFDQLRDGGVAVGPVGTATRQRLWRWTKHGDTLEAEDLGMVRFVPMLRGAE